MKQQRMWIVTALLCGIVVLSTGLAWATTWPPQRVQIAHPTATLSHSAQRMQATATPAQRAQVVGGAPAPYLGLVNMGMPAAPQPFMSDSIAVSLHAHFDCNPAVLNGYGPPADNVGCSMTADHGTACEPPPTTHTISGNYASAMFICHDHVMTAVNAVGTSAVAFQPNQLVDFSTGPATVGIHVSTFRSSMRDWIDFVFMPWSEQVAYASDGNVGESEKVASDYIRVRMDTQNNEAFVVTESVGGVEHDVPSDYLGLLTTGLTPSKSVRTPISMTLSQTHFTLAANGHTFVDADLPVRFPVTQVVAQFEQLNYDPDKTDFGPPPEQAALGLPAQANTWHWSNLSISRAIPYYQVMAMPSDVGESWLRAGLGNRVTFPPAPAGAYLRFHGYDYAYSGFANGYAISFDNGATWQSWHMAGTRLDNHQAPFWQPIPVGATSAILRGPSNWYARDFYVMSLTGARASLAAPTAMRMSPGPAAPLPPTDDPSTAVIADATRASVGRRGGLSS